MTMAMSSALPTFNLSYVERRLRKEHWFWSSAKVARAVAEYRAYFAACKANRYESLNPTKLADEVWHAHILFTKDYARDCQDYFGYFLDHIPERAATEEGIAWFRELPSSTRFAFYGLKASACSGHDCTGCDNGGGCKSASR